MAISEIPLPDMLTVPGTDGWSEIESAVWPRLPKVSVPLDCWGVDGNHEGEKFASMTTMSITNPFETQPVTFVEMDVAGGPATLVKPVPNDAAWSTPETMDAIDATSVGEVKLTATV